MQTPKPRNGTLDVPKRVSPRAVSKPKAIALETVSSSSPKQAVRTPKERSPKVVDRRSPKSPIPEKKRPSKISELESQISQLQEQLKKANDQLSESESWKKQAQIDAEESQKQLLTMSSKLEESQKLLIELENSTKEEGRVPKPELDAVEEQDSADFTDLASAVNQIQRLKAEVHRVAESEAAQTKEAESAHLELESLKGNLMETLSLVEDMKDQLKDSKEAEANAQTLASETLLQLESAKESIEALRSEGAKTTEAYNIISSELDDSKARVNSLEELVSKLKTDLAEATNHTQEAQGDENVEKETGSDEKGQLEAEVALLKSEIEQLRAALESKTGEDKIERGVSEREAELLAEMEKAKLDIEEMKRNLMDKENELRGIVEDNEELHMKIEKSLSNERGTELETELKKLNEVVADLKADMMDKENELQNISEENEMLRLEVSKRGQEGHENEAVARERDALMKLGLAMEEAEKNNRRAARVAEQLNAAQAGTAEMEAELRKLKVQSDQWRKAAEAAAAMISAGNNGKLMERTGSLDSHYNAVAGKGDSPYADDIDDDLLKKKNGNMLKKFGVLWKKPQK